MHYLPAIHPFTFQEGTQTGEEDTTAEKSARKKMPKKPEKKKAVISDKDNTKNDDKANDGKTKVNLSIQLVSIHYFSLLFCSERIRSRSLVLRGWPHQVWILTKSGRTLMTRKVQKAQKRRPQSRESSARKRKRTRPTIQQTMSRDFYIVRHI